MSPAKKYYAVAVGRRPGVYTQWFGLQGAEVQVRGFLGAQFKGFATRAEAETFVKTGFSRQRPPSAPASGTKSRTPPSPKRQIVVYTDGGAINNPGPGGYGVVIKGPNMPPKELSGGFRLTTNNRMELTACIVGLAALQETAQKVAVVSDSKYVVDGITKGWAKRWQKNKWMRTKTEPAINPDLWEQLLKLCQRHWVTFHWIKGHAGHPENERCDQLAVSAARGQNLGIDAVYEALKKRPQ